MLPEFTVPVDAPVARVIAPPAVVEDVPVKMLMPPAVAPVPVDTVIVPDVAVDPPVYISMAPEFPEAVAAPENILTAPVALVCEPLLSVKAPLVVVSWAPVLPVRSIVVVAVNAVVVSVVKEIALGRPLMAFVPDSTNAAFRSAVVEVLGTTILTEPTPWIP
jgi:hypothetical protein